MITIHPASASDTSTLGLGALTPIEAYVEERAGGLYQLTLTHSTAGDNRWTLIQKYALLKAPVPARETPFVEITGRQSATVTRRIYAVDTGASGMRLNLRTMPGGGKILHAYRPGTEVMLLDGTNETWYRVAVMKNGQSGYMSAHNLRFLREETETIASDSPGTVVKPVQAREQLFRVYEVETDDAARTVTAKALHVSYDLARVALLGEMEFDGVTAADAVNGMLQAASHEHPFTVHCLVEGTVSGSFTGKSLAAALWGDGGVVSQTGARLVRDNYEIWLLPDEPRDTGVEIRHGKNLTGATASERVSDVVTRVYPVGKAKDGSRMPLPDGEYVESASAALIPVISAREIEYDVQIGKDGIADASAAYAKLRTLAAAEFSENGIDATVVGLDVDFAQLENTAEYRRYAGLETVFLYDTVHVMLGDSAWRAALRVTGYRWRLTGAPRYEEVLLGEISDLETPISGYDLTDGTLPGTKLINGSVSGGKLRNLSIDYAKIGSAAIGQLSADALEAVKAHVRDLAAGTISADELYAGLAKIAVAEVKKAKIGTADIDWANIGTANINWANIGTLTARVAALARAEIAAATIGEAQVENLTARYAHLTDGVIDNAKIGWADIDNLDAGYLNALKAKLQTAEITNLIANQINAGSIAVSNLDASNAKIGYANIYDLSADHALISKGVGGKFYFDNLAVTAAMITELTVGKLLMRDTETGHLKRIVVNSSSPSGYSVEDAGRTIRGDDIVTQSIVADNLNVSEIFANTALINQIHGRCINVATLFAQEAFISQLDSYVIRANTISAIESNLNLTADGAILMAVGKNLHSGGKNMLRMSKTFEKGSDTTRQWMWWHEWSDNEPYGVSLMSTAPETGFKHILFRGEGLTENQWAGVWSPMIELPSAKNTTTGVSLGDWYGRKVTLSAYVYSGSWRNVDGFQFMICLSDGTRTRKKYGGKRVFYINSSDAVVWGDDVKCDQNIKSGAWRRIAITFTLDENDISASTDDSIAFQDCTHMFAAFYFTKNGNARIYAPKLEWGTLASDWSAAPEDSLDETNTILNTLFTIEDGQIKGFVSEQTYNSDINNASTGLKKLVSDNTTFRTQTSTYISDFVRSTAWGSPTDNLGNIFTKMWSGVTANREGLTLEAGKLIGSTQLMRRTKGMPTSVSELGYGNTPPSDVDTSSATLWRKGIPTSEDGTVTITRTLVGSGEYSTWIRSSGHASPIWSAIHSPLVSLGGSWVGRQVTFSFYVRSPDWTQVDDVVSVYLNLTTGISSGRLYTTGKALNKVATAEWADTDGLVHEMALRNANWRRAAVTFTLTEAEIPKYGTHDTSFSSCTHMYITFYLRKNGEVGFRLPKLEWGAKASDWAEASEDVNDSSSAKIKITDDRLLSTVNKLNNRSDTNIDTAISQVEQTANSWRSVVTTVNGNGTQGNGLVSKVTKIEQSEAFLNLIAGKFSNVDDEGAASRSVVVNITPEKFSVTANGDGSTGKFELDDDGGTMNELTISGKLNLPGKILTEAYTGPARVSVGPGQDYETLAGFANMISGKWLNYTVTATLTMSSDDPADTEKATFIGIGGKGWINLVGDASAKYQMQASANHATIIEFTDVQNIISISNMTFVTYANTNGNFGIHFANCYFEISNCVFTGPGVSSGGGRGILANRGARGYVNNCEFYDYEYGVLSQSASDVSVNNSKGNSRLGGVRGRMIVTGTASSNTTTFNPRQEPAGAVTYGTVTVDQGSKPTVPTQPSVSTYVLSATDSYSPGNGAWNFAQHNDPMQGYTGGAIIKGCMWFASMSGLSGKTIKSAKIRLYQESGVGRGGSVPVTLYGTNTVFSGRSSEPPITTTYGAIGSTNPGENTELSIPTAAITDLVSGTIKALMIYTDEHEVYKGRQYSKNYARFRGSTTGDASTKPLITVTYV